MAFIQMTINSNVLGMDTNVNVLLPETRHGEETLIKKSYPVVYVLHGYGDNHTSWIRKSMIEFIARDLDVIVVMPEVYNGFYINNTHGFDYFTYISEELPIKIANFFPISLKREDTFIMGNSMGGYGAFRIAMAKPAQYAAAVSFSGILGLDIHNNIFQFTNRDMKTIENVFGLEESFEESENSLLYLAKKLDACDDVKPRLYHFCGKEDNITYSEGLKFIEFVKKNTSLTVRYEESSGGHNWLFWNTYIEKAFEFFGFTIPELEY